MSFTYVVLRSEPHGTVIASAHTSRKAASAHASKLAGQALRIWGEVIYYVARIEYIEGFEVREESAV